jgi:GNAT superfamily N-acetyltransferase
MADVVVQPLTPDLLGDWLAFFDHDAFADNPDWSGCYCQWFHVDHEHGAWESRTPEENRAASIDLIAAGRLQGYLAYVGGRAAGWCQAAPRLEIPNMANDPELAVEDADHVGSIVCFLVAQPSRGQGVAAGLLDAACAGFRERGLGVAEAYPRRTAEGDAANYHGPLALYLRGGFKPYREVGESVIVRRELSG